MGVRAFSKRNLKELLRDPLNFMFALGFPLIVLLLLHVINSSVPTSIFPISTLAPGIAVFGLSFIALFSGMLLAKDRSTSFLMRLFASPLSSGEFLISYTLPLLPIAMGQTLICLTASMLLGLPANGKIALLFVTLIPAMLLFIALGLLCGTLFSDKQVGGVCGALLTNVSAWLSGTWFDLKLIGGMFETIAYCLPFAHAVDAGKAALAGDYAQIMPHLVWVIGYALVTSGIAIIVFKQKMKNASI